MRLIFMGAPAFAVPTLKALSSLGAQIVAVYTKEPKRAGRRGLELTRTPVHVAAEHLGLSVETPTSLREPATVRRLAAFGADAAIVAAYGLLLPADVLALIPLGCFNLHGSLLPRWRGAAPVQRAIMAGDAETGVSIMRMEAGLDTGPIAGELRTPIGPLENSEDLMGRLAELAAETMRQNWSALSSGSLIFAPQSTVGVEYARKIDKAEAPIDWTLPAWRVRGHIHGLAPFPGATAAAGAGASERFKILRAEVVERQGAPGQILDEHMTVACGDGAIRILQIQRPGRSAVSGGDFILSGVMRVGQTFRHPI